MHPEKFIYDRLGVRKEYPGTNILAVSILAGLSNAYGFLSGLEIKGYIPA